MRTQRGCRVYLFTLLLAAAAQPSVRAQDQCLACHEAMEDKSALLFKRDVHFLKGLSCASCHGGDKSREEMDESMNKEAGFLGVPSGDEVSSVCAACHSDEAVIVKTYRSSLPVDQMASLTASVHGKSSIKGDQRIAQCTTCHGAHGILSKNNRSSPVHPLNVPATCAKCHSNPQYLRSYNPALPVDQLDKYRTSVHGKKNAAGDANVAECASCHGSHDILPAKDVRSRVYATNLPGTCGSCHSDATLMRKYRIPADQLVKYSRSVHGIALLQKKDLGAPACNDCHGNHGAVPPGVESISKVCGTCHALNAELFSASPHKKAFDQRKLPECETCHSHHDVVAATDELLGVGKEAVCAWCHSPEKSPGGYEVARTMRTFVDSLLAEENKATQLVAEAEQKGMEVGEAKFKLREVRQARLESRTKVHSFDESQFREVAERGLTSAAAVSEEAAEAFVYIRRLEKEQSSRGPF
ncbi:MAG: cytochrome c3 family protein [Ignavibacteriales bacterium]|nr:cytochrome c3 family protein [Ignavibacteriales bacterium]